MVKTLKEAVVRRIGDTRGWELVLDGDVFPFHTARQELPVETVIDEEAPLHIMYLPVYVENVIGAAEFNEFLADEADRSRVWYADQRDLRKEMLAS